MQEQTPFSTQLKRYISMAMKIWPSLRVGMRHISDITGVQQHSLLPRRNYHTMTQEQFLNTLIDDMHLFIMEHDVKEQDIEDYLNDILDLLSIDQDCSVGNMMGSVRFMSRQVIKVITQLQDGKTTSVDKFETNIYNPVIQMGVGQAIQQGGDDSEDEMEQEEGGYEDDSEEWDEEDDEEMEEEEEKSDEKEEEEKKKQQQQLEDDGWVVVKKRK